MLTYLMYEEILSNNNYKDIGQYLFFILSCLMFILLDIILSPLEIIAGIMYLIHKRKGR